MELSTVDAHKHELMSLLGVTADDEGLVARGETTAEVIERLLTRGCRKAQRWMLDQGYYGWRKRSTALSWSGGDSTDGGRYASLPTDFLRALGRDRESALQEANGNRWGRQVNPEDSELRGNGYYFLGDQVWLLRNANPPSTLYLVYHYQHPVWTGLLDANIDFPTDARPLIVAEGANTGKEESWFALDQDQRVAIDRAVRMAREDARNVARQSKATKKFRRPVRWGTHW